MDFRERSFADEEIELDGNHYYDCTFMRCVLIYKGLEKYTLIGCAFIKPRFSLRGPAGNGLKFLKQIHGNMASDGKLWLENSLMMAVFGVVLKSEDEIKPIPTTAFDLEDSSIELAYVSLRGFDKVVEAKEGSKASIKNSLISRDNDLGKLDLDALKVLVGQAIESESTPDIEPAVIEAIREELTKLRNELSKEQPENVVLQESLKTLRNIIEGIAGGMLTPILVQQLPYLLRLIGLA